MICFIVAIIFLHLCLDCAGMDAVADQLAVTSAATGQIIILECHHVKWSENDAFSKEFQQVLESHNREFNPENLRLSKRKRVDAGASTL